VSGVSPNLGLSVGIKIKSVSVCLSVCVCVPIEFRRAVNYVGKMRK